MSVPTYNGAVSQDRKPLVWCHGEIKTPPFSKEARVEPGTLLRRLQEGENLSLAPFPAYAEHWEALP
jgi:hypothetical protein